MTSALCRKRSRLDIESDDEDIGHGANIQSNPTAAAPFGDLKRSKTQSELDELSIIPASGAWTIDVDSLLSSPTLATSSEKRVPHNNGSRYVRGESIIILCVQGGLHLHYDLLWYALPSPSEVTDQHYGVFDGI